MTARLPDLVIVGAPKAGTTTLAHWLRNHPGVAVSRKKELEYFDRYYDRGPSWYLEQLPQDPGDRLVVEATPTYLSEPGVAERVARDLPEARFVAVLREPVARAWSNYSFFRQLGLDRRSWTRAIEQSSDAPSAQDPLGYLWRGRYAEQLARWDGLLGPDRLLPILFDDLIADPQGEFDRICTFAGIGSAPLKDRESVNTTRRPRSARLQLALAKPQAGRLRRRLYAWNAQGRPVPALDPRDETVLRARFAASNDALAERLGRSLPPSWSA
ncbi:MAG: sulfotransferase [Actinomycetota bacterium]|nr:sulfotransferase [Actinomycetota bacterium]